MLKKCDGRTDERTDGGTDEQTDLCIELRYAQLIKGRILAHSATHYKARVWREPACVYVYRPLPK